jgi:rhamnulose-1-phosphate aldolase
MQTDRSEARPRPRPISEPYPTLEELMHLIGEAGTRLVEIEAAEGAAGNISVFVGWDVDVSAHFPREQSYPCPSPCPNWPAISSW